MFVDKDRLTKVSEMILTSQVKKLITEIKKYEWTKINKEQLEAKTDLQCVFSNEELFQTDSDVKEFEEEW